MSRRLARYWKAVNDPRTPKLVKYFILGSVGVSLVPEGWLPEWVPSLTIAEEAALIPSLITAATLFIPKEALVEVGGPKALPLSASA